MWMIYAAWIKENGMTIVLLALTFLCALYDIRKKEIPILPMAFGIVFSLIIWILRIFTGNAEIWEMFFAAVPGAFLLAVGVFSKEKVGCGDGILLIMIGLMTGFTLCLGILCIGLVCSCIYALFLIIFHKAKKGDCFAFAPFLALAVGVCKAAEGWIR